MPLVITKMKSSKTHTCTRPSDQPLIPPYTIYIEVCWGISVDFDGRVQVCLKLESLSKLVDFTNKKCEALKLPR